MRIGFEKKVEMMEEKHILREMNDYYRDRIPYHDQYMSYTDNEQMERLLEPIISLIEGGISGRDVLEIACGTGNWTQVLSKRALRVTATDLHEGYLLKAKEKDYQKKNVTFKVADAYSLCDIEGWFEAAFCADWFSHIPRSKIGDFTYSLRKKLQPNAEVVIIDMMRTKELNGMFSHVDSEGNEVQRRTLPNGREYEVIKNFPDEDELMGHFREWGKDIKYHENHELARWVLTLRTKGLE